MMATLSVRTGRTLLAGLAAAGAIVAAAPLARAEPGDECVPQDTATSDQQPCEEQKQQAPGKPDLPRPDPQQAQKDPNQGIDLADKDCWVVRGVPTMWSPALSTGPGEQAWPCYYVYGLTPH